MSVASRPVDSGFWLRLRLWLVLLTVAVATAAGQEAATPQIILPVGAPREEVFSTYGWPTGQSQAGSREVLNYPQGTVLLRDGRVERITFSTSKPWPPPRVQPPSAAELLRRSEALSSTSKAASPEPAAVQPARNPGATGLPPAPAALASSLTNAWKLIIGGIAVGSAVTVVLLWLLWGKWNVRRPPTPRDMSARIANAASGVPAVAEVLDWPKPRVVAVMAGLAEADAYAVTTQPDEADADLMLRRPDEPDVRVAVMCLGGEAGIVSVRRVRELAAMMTATGAGQGWLIAPRGFVPEARAYARERNLRLVDGEVLIGLLRDLPPLTLPKVLTRTV